MKSPAALSCFVVLAGCALSCGGTSRPTTQMVAATPLVSSASAPAPLPPGPEARELAGLFGNVCQLVSRPKTALTEAKLGCACCAPFDGCTPSDPPFDAYQDAYFPAQVVAGAFTRPHVEQRAVPMLGCEPHSYNYGGMLLLERGPNGFFVDRYLSGFFAGQCRAVRRNDGRDLLVCERDDVHQGVRAQLIFQWDLATPEPQLADTEPLLDAEDNEMSGCWSELGSAVSSSQIVSFTLAEVAGATRLMLELDVREGRVTDAYIARCRELEASPVGSRPEPSRRPRALLPSRTERVAFRFDGSGFVPSSP